MTLKEKALDDVLGRVEKNILPVLDSEQDANGFLGASIAEALPWLISVPSIRTKIPKMVAGMLPSGIPASPPPSGGNAGPRSSSPSSSPPARRNLPKKRSRYEPVFLHHCQQESRPAQARGAALPFRSRTRPAE